MTLNEPVKASVSSLYPSAKAEPEMAGTSLDENVVATVEMTPIHELKAEPTIAILSQSPQNPYPIHLQEKMGSKCCGCCCDFRRAVMVCNSIFIGVAVFLIIVRGSIDEFIQEQYQDDQLGEEISDIIEEYYTTRSIFLGVAIGTSVLAQAGAVCFNIYLVMIHCLWIVVDYVLFLILALRLEQDLQEAEQETSNPVPGFVFNGVILGCLLYPHFGFIAEVRAGVMTAETYPREDYCCCCSERRNRHLPPPAM